MIKRTVIYVVHHGLMVKLHICHLLLNKRESEDFEIILYT